MITFLTFLAATSIPMEFSRAVRYNMATAIFLPRKLLLMVIDLYDIVINKPYRQKALQNFRKTMAEI